MWASSAGIVRTRKAPRRKGGAVLLPPCKRRAAVLAELECLKRMGVRREAKKRKLHMSWGLVELATDELQIPPDGLICGQAALVSATGLPLAALGIERCEPSPQQLNNQLSFACLNRMLEESCGAGQAFVLRKPLPPKPLPPAGDSRWQLSSATDVFGREQGVYIVHTYYVPGDDFEGGRQLPYGAEVLSCRRSWPSRPNPPSRAPLTTLALLPRPTAGWR